jgi:hypothetical protein
MRFLALARFFGGIDGGHRLGIFLAAAGALSWALDVSRH